MRLGHLSIIFSLFSSTALHANFSTCEGLMSWIASGKARKPIVGETPIVWPKSLASQESLRGEVGRAILEHWESAPTKRFVTFDGKHLPYKEFPVPNERGAVIIPPGHKTDKSEFRELIYTLNQEGYSAYTYDHRGQGQADRLTKNFQTAHVADFRHYIRDFGTFVDIVSTTPRDRTFVIAPSMGAMISTHYVHENPNRVDALAALAPAYGINLRGFPRFIAKAGIRLRMMFFGESKYGPFSHDKTPENFLSMERKVSEPTRIKMENERAKEDPHLYMGGASNRLSYELIDYSKKALKLAPSFKTPILVFEAGSDVIITPREVRSFAKQAENASHLCLARANHCLNLEGDFVRNVMMSDLLRFLVHPEPLNMTPRGDEVKRMMSDVDRYAEKGDIALAKYTVDEIDRTIRTHGKKVPEWTSEALTARIDALRKNINTRMDSEDVGAYGLYQFLTFRREQELSKTSKNLDENQVESGEGEK